MKQTPHAEWLIGRLEKDESGKLGFARGSDVSIPKYLAQALTKPNEAKRVVDELLRLVAVLHGEGAMEAARLVFTKLQEHPLTRAALLKSGNASFKKFTGAKATDKAPELNAPAPKGALRVSDQVSALRRKVRG